MTLIESLEHRTSVLRAREVAALFQVTPQHIYKMAAKGAIPSFKVAGAIGLTPGYWPSGCAIGCQYLSRKARTC